MASGFFDSVKKEAKMAADTISKEASHLATSASHAYNEHRSSKELDMFRSGNVLQLVSRSSGKCLQIVKSDQDQLVVDGLGQDAPAQPHTHWTVMDEGKNIVKLHNNFNFLAIENGSLSVKACNSMPSSAETNSETKFRLSQNNHYVLFESLNENGAHIGILPTGELKSALATSEEHDAQFAIRIIEGTPKSGPEGKADAKA